MSSSLRLVAAATALLCLPWSSARAENRTAIQITAVRASNNGRGFDSRLASLKTELKQLRFRNYRLVKTETRELHGNGGQCAMVLPGGRFLNITTREHTPNHLRLHILLNEDNRPVVNTFVKLEHGSVVMMGGPRDDNGTLVITIASRPMGRQTGSDRSKSRGKGAATASRSGSNAAMPSMGLVPDSPSGSTQSAKPAKPAKSGKPATAPQP